MLISQALKVLLGPNFQCLSVNAKSSTIVLALEGSTWLAGGFIYPSTNGCYLRYLGRTVVRYNNNFILILRGRLVA